jgi:alkyldihydroxyacetonephosphate synthase
MIVSVDMTRMNRVKWVDKVNMMACVEAGIIGQDLDRTLMSYGVTMGHEPVSILISLIPKLGLCGILYIRRMDIN